MIVVKVELHSAVTHEVTELGRMIVHNIGGTYRIGKYRVCLGRKGQTDQDVLRKPQREGHVDNYPRISASVWVLVARALRSVRFKDAEDPEGLPAELDRPSPDLLERQEQQP